MAAVKALSAFRDKWGSTYKVYVPQGERLEYHDYIALLKQSKLVVSPWGWGEWSHKDFEILMSGCVVIKPRTDIFRLHPPIFEVRRRSWSAAAALGPHGAGTRWLPRAGCQGRALPSCPPFPAACLP
jgi:hypothetical protein